MERERSLFLGGARSVSLVSYYKKQEKKKNTYSLSGFSGAFDMMVVCILSLSLSLSLSLFFL